MEMDHLTLSVHSYSSTSAYLGLFIIVVVQPSCFNDILLGGATNIIVVLDGSSWCGGAVLTIVVADQLCVKREMLEGLSVVPVRKGDLQTEKMELGQLFLPRIDYGLHWLYGK
jgi:hypothetical protein